MSEFRAGYSATGRMPTSYSYPDASGTVTLDRPLLVSPEDNTIDIRIEEPEAFLQFSDWSVDKSFVSILDQGYNGWETWFQLYFSGTEVTSEFGSISISSDRCGLSFIINYEMCRHISMMPGISCRFAL